ncbi:response regulator [Inmirania thermothiophila]|uniref:LuxR family two component transcriptional regulator n=1 Tax=Inmirania thermothiophila TaxID=1750597 RepID=A0A3N1Y3L2_9GAMM|nr:response regulator [Inmirania thermothiophila]ROR32162.1 LuxR family two component transcriptional regulator [Inmirania thermothiophila]
MRVLIIDDHALFRVGLQELLERRGIEVVGAVGDGVEGMELAERLRPDIVLLDLRMPRMDGLQVLHAMRQRGLEMPVVMLTTSAEEQDLVESLRSGAQGYLIKDMEPDEVVRALRDAVRGETVIAPELSRLLARVVRGEQPEPGHGATPFDGLTPREREILCHLAEGESNKVIARHLGISDGTVKLHVKAILRKLGVHSRVEAAVMAVEHGLHRPRIADKG